MIDISSFSVPMMNSSRSDYAGSSRAHNMPVVEDVPSTLLESFLPGFGVLRRVVLVSVGFDIQTLVAGAFLLGVLFSGSQYLWKRILHLWWRFFTAEIAVSSAHSLHEDVLSWMGAHILKDDTQRLNIGHRRHWYDYEFDFQSEPRPIVYSPSYGPTVFWYRGRRFTLYRDEPNKEARYFWMQEKFRLSISGFSTSPIKRFLEECRRYDKEQSRFKTFISVPDHSGDKWARDIVRPSRPIDTIYMNDRIKDNLVKDAQKFATRKAMQFYASRGIPYRRGYLFHGPPGTGKSSMSFALAGMLGCTIHYCSLSDSNMNDAKLRALFNDVENNSMILLEDIDAVGVARDTPGTRTTYSSNSSDDGEDDTVSDAGDKSDPESDDEGEKSKSKKSGKSSSKKKGQKITLAGLLNVLDGVASGEGRIVIMTTNDPEALDPALVRPGRVDLQVYFGHATKTHAHDMYLRFFPEEGELDSEGQDETTRDSAKNAEETPVFEEHNKSSIAEDNKNLESTKTITRPTQEMAEKFANMVPDHLVTPAEIQGFLLVRSDDPQKALDEFANWINQMKATKAAGKNIIETVGSTQRKKSEENLKLETSPSTIDSVKAMSSDEEPRTPSSNNSKTSSDL